MFGVDIEEYLKQIMGAQEDPDEDLQKMDMAEEMLKCISVEGGFTVPEKDQGKHVVLGGKYIFYPPKEYYGKSMTSGAFVDMIKKYKIVPVSVSNIHFFTTWKDAKDLWGYALLFKHLYETYNIIPVMKEKDDAPL
jgi:hypothetical protein